MSGVAPDLLDRIVEEFDVHGTLETRQVLALLEVARAARAVVQNGARMPPSDPPLFPDEISDLRAALARLEAEA